MLEHLVAIGKPHGSQMGLGDCHLDISIYIGASFANYNEKNIKKRYWVCVLYPESAPEDWRQILTETGLQCAVSPLHDKDINPDGEPKKPHYHVILCYSGPTTYNTVKALTDKLNQPVPQALDSVKGYYRYFTHKDNPEKYQYSEDEITTINGFDIGEWVELTQTEINKFMHELNLMIYEKEITEYCDLLALLAFDESEHSRELEHILQTHTIHFNALIRSRRHKKLEEEQNK